MKLFFDIETIPADEKFKILAIELGLAKLKRKASTANKTLKITKKLKEEIFRNSALSGDFGRILCIGYALGDSQVEVILGDEPEIIRRWWQIADKADLFIGHNIIDFDLRFIFKRSIIHKIKPSAKHLNLSFARYRNFPIYDTMREWEKWNPESFISLDTLAQILGLESSKKGGIDGSQVYNFYLAGKYQEIYDYCKKDVSLSRLIYKRMTFSD